MASTATRPLGELKKYKVEIPSRWRTSARRSEPRSTQRPKASVRADSASPGVAAKPEINRSSANMSAAVIYRKSPDIRSSRHKTYSVTFSSPRSSICGKSSLKNGLGSRSKLTLAGRPSNVILLSLNKNQPQSTRRDTKKNPGDTLCPLWLISSL